MKLIEVKREKRAKQAQKKTNIELQIEVYRGYVETLDSDIAIRDTQLEDLEKIIEEVRKIKEQSSNVDRRIYEFTNNFEYSGHLYSEDEHYLDLKKESDSYEKKISELVSEFKRKYYGK